ncbi:hypothetical protein MSG28_015129 [Choristoneura fumiferana]|uniref:Uncharacterized protein n=1 Tax=Choristoneura fumiferana TaxID=7141 RepID=A0ACC0KYG2_CHOFU|nr:hypothetical protein MSG28_015129 [Choristoneura fumiferana]
MSSRVLLWGAVPRRLAALPLWIARLMRCSSVSFQTSKLNSKTFLKQSGSEIMYAPAPEWEYELGLWGFCSTAATGSQQCVSRCNLEP